MHQAAAINPNAQVCRLYHVDLQPASCGRHSIDTSSNALAADTFSLYHYIYSTNMME